MLVSDKARKKDNSWFAETKLDIIPEQTMVEQYTYFDEAKEYLLNSGVVTMAHSSDLYLNTYCFEKQTNKQVKSATCLAASLCGLIILCHNRLEGRRIVFLLVAV